MMMMQSIINGKIPTKQKVDINGQELLVIEHNQWILVWTHAFLPQHLKDS
jgi:hypothetical protein